MEEEVELGRWFDILLLGLWSMPFEQGISELLRGLGLVMS
jgi:hypothetical protein